MAKPTKLEISVLDIEPVMAVVETAGVLLKTIADHGMVAAHSDEAIALQDAMDGLLEHLREGGE